ncbi:MAG: putative ABC transporter permease [Treponema sp.]|nr:putative ABC transporter permease [Treponema sp.]
MSVQPVYALPFHITFLIFIIFSLVGWLSEVLYVGIFFEHKFVNRGFLHGPICPIYGFGGLTILLLPQSLYSTWGMLFCASMLFGTIVEYLSSWILEKLFHTRWWDYSHYKFNIRGRVCLLNSLLFGVLGVVIIHFVQPYVMWYLSLFPEFVLKLSADIIAIALTVDLLITVRRLVDFSVSLEKLRALKEKYGAEFTRALDQLQPKIRNIESFVHRFPTLKSLNYKEELDLLKQRIKNVKSKFWNKKPPKA